MTKESTIHRRYRRLLKDFGYDYRDGVILQGRRVFGYSRSLMGACERLCPIIREPEFTRRMIAIWDTNN